jgi:hypothetical protein
VYVAVYASVVCAAGKSGRSQTLNEQVMQTSSCRAGEDAQKSRHQASRRKGRYRGWTGAHETANQRRKRRRRRKQYSCRKRAGQARAASQTGHQTKQSATREQIYSLERRRTKEKEHIHTHAHMQGGTGVTQNHKPRGGRSGTLRVATAVQPSEGKQEHQRLGTSERAGERRDSTRRHWFPGAKRGGTGAAVVVWWPRFWWSVCVCSVVCSVWQHGVQRWR